MQTKALRRRHQIAFVGQRQPFEIGEPLDLTHIDVRVCPYPPIVGMAARAEIEHGAQLFALALLDYVQRLAGEVLHGAPFRQVAVSAV